MPRLTTLLRVLGAIAGVAGALLVAEIGLGLALPAMVRQVTRPASLDR